MWVETSIGTKEFLYVCVHKEKLKSMFEQYSIDLLRLLSLLLFCTIKSFVNSCSGPLVFILLSLSLELVQVLYISVNPLHNLASRSGLQGDRPIAGLLDGARTDHATKRTKLISVSLVYHNLMVG